ncbi:AI-2E family transporter [Butyrivibrio sp. INlla21]|uniref:AI-2E family transporter n=1 Tax=Butyrivibrio sp. INlla21 TaxID=1520811 RepID=UPI0008E49CF6|nr:AI-2E family transporter [Butyrivibrio sp. INlla21]SFV01575.1 Predicted PurR-regulated permease PerM [Butyrivibrio sp. INlla21]
MKFNNKWFKKKWVAYTIATCSAVILYMILSHITGLFSIIKSFFSFIRPIIIAIVIAYIFDPMAKLLQRSVFKKIKRESTKWKLSVAGAIIIILTAVSLLFAALIPQIGDSVSTFVSNIGGYIDSSQKLLQSLENGGGRRMFGFDVSGLAEFGEKILKNIGDYFSNNMDSFVSSSVNAGKGVFDTVIAFILAIYFMIDKKRIIDGFAKIMRLIMKEKTFKNSADLVERCNAILIRYISFDIIDGIIVGIVNFIYMLIAGQPYSVLISVIVAITNLAPTFGPIVGCAIGSFILVLVNPWYALWFILFTIVLQTIDGYILKPRLFGESLGVSPLMILIAIILGGRLFGVPGILLAIPFAAILDFVFKDYVLKKLEEKHSQRYNM